MDNYFSTDKKIKEKLLSENNIVPQTIHQLFLESGSKLTMKRKKRFTLKYLVASILLVVVGFTSLGVANPIFAQGLPVIGSVFKQLNQMLYSNYDDYSSDMNISSTDHGYKVTINKVAYDGISLAMAYTITSKAPLPIHPDSVEMNFEINGKVYWSQVVGNLSGKLSKDKKTFHGIVETILAQNNSTPSQTQGKISTDYVEILPDKFHLKINIQSFDINTTQYEKFVNDRITGRWSFNMFVTNEKLKGKVKEIKTAINLNTIDKDLSVTKLITTPLNTILQGTIFNYDHDIDFLIYDNDGRRLLGKGGGIGEMGLTTCFSYTYKEIYKGTKSLTFIPYELLKTPKTEQPQLLSADLNLNGKTNIPISRNGSLEITKVEVKNGKTNVYYRTTHGFRARPDTIVDKTTNKKFHIINTDKYLKSNDEYVVSFDTTLKNEKYLIQYYYFENIKTFDDQKFTIMIEHE